MRALLVVVLVSLAASPALAQIQALKPAARAKLDRGMKLASDKKYEDAIKELRSGYVMSEAREFLYAMGQVERLRGNCAGALMHYQAFLDTTPPPEQGNAARLQKERCEAETRAVEAKADPTLAPRKDAPVEAPAPVVAPVVVAAPPAPAPVVAPVVVVTAQPEPSPWYRDVPGDALLGAGVVAVASGAAMFAVGNLATRNARTSLDRYTAAQNLSWAQPAGVAVAGVGGALLVGSVVRFALRAPDAAAAPSLAVWLDDHGGAVALSGRF